MEYCDTSKKGEQKNQIGRQTRKRFQNGRRQPCHSAFLFRFITSLIFDPASVNFEGKRCYLITVFTLDLFSLVLILSTVLVTPDIFRVGWCEARKLSMARVVFPGGCVPWAKKVMAHAQDVDGEDKEALHEDAQQQIQDGGVPVKGRGQQLWKKIT